MAFLRRTKSFEKFLELKSYTKSGDLIATRGGMLFGDDQSLLDRSTMTQTMTYEPSPHEEYQETPSPSSEKF